MVFKPVFTAEQISVSRHRGAEGDRKLSGKRIGPGRTLESANLHAEGATRRCGESLRL